MTLRYIKMNQLTGLILPTLFSLNAAITIDCHVVKKEKEMNGLIGVTLRYQNFHLKLLYRERSNHPRFHLFEYNPKNDTAKQVFIDKKEDGWNGNEERYFGEYNMLPVKEVY